MADGCTFREGRKLLPKKLKCYSPRLGKALIRVNPSTQTLPTAVYSTIAQRLRYNSRLVLQSREHCQTNSLVIDLIHRSTFCDKVIYSTNTALMLMCLCRESAYQTYFWTTAPPRLNSGISPSF